MDITMAQAREFNLRLVVEFRTGDGDVTEIDGPHTVESSNPAIASLLSQDDSTLQHEVIYELHPVAGQTILSGFADADLGEGVRTVPWSFEVNLVVGEATVASITVGELIPKVEA